MLSKSIVILGSIVTSTITEPVSTKQDILTYLLRSPQAKAIKIAQALEVSPQAIRRHLKDLEIEGLIEYKTVQIGMGRPQYLYSLSKQGKECFPNRYGEFAVSFLDTLSRTLGEKQVGEVLRKQWEEKAVEYRERLGTGSIEDRLNRLVELRRKEGYMAEIYPQSSNMFIFLERHCVISDVAESYPSVCGHELEMFSAILADALVERTHWLNNGEHTCGYLIKAKS